MKKLLVAALSVFFVSTIYANCPAPQTVQYICNDGHCSWSPKGGWYEGSNPSGFTPLEGAKVARFILARWVPYSGPDGGATTCYYADEQNNLVTLVQQTKYGEVPKPDKGPWEKDPANHSYQICVASAETCYFDFGERF
jgi:hypothetical protein